MVGAVTIGAPRPLSVRLRPAAIAVALCAVAPARAAPPDAPSPAPSAAGERQSERALSLHNEARELYQRGEYRAAIAKLQSAAALDPAAKELVYNLAVIHEKLGEIDAAEAYYRRYLAMEPEPKARQQVEAVLRRLEGARKELAPAAAPSHAEPALASALGLVPPPQTGGRPLGPWGVATGGVAIGALVIGNVFALSAVVRDPGDDAATGGDVSVQDLQVDARTAHRDAVIADVAFVVAGIAGGTALYLYLSTPPRRPAAVAPEPPAPAPPRPFSREQRALGRVLTPRDPGAAAGPGVGLSLGAGGARVRVRF